MLNKLKSPRLWSGVAGAVTILLLAFGVRVPAPAVNEILGVVSGILVLFGIVPIPPSGGGEEPESEKESESEKKPE